MHVSIRPATPSDQAALAALYLHVRRHTMTWIPVERFTLEDFAQHSRAEDVLVAQGVDGHIAGFISVWSPDRFIHMLYVHPGWQGRHVGSALLEALPAWKTHDWRLKCLVMNHRARAFYVRRGFEIIGQGESPDGRYDDMLHKGHPSVAG